eukprot:6189298-Pleurochrysis_carterae.AAC.3
MTRSSCEISICGTRDCVPCVHARLHLVWWLRHRRLCENKDRRRGSVQQVRGRELHSQTSSSVRKLMDMSSCAEPIPLADVDSARLRINAALQYK